MGRDKKGKNPWVKTRKSQTLKDFKTDKNLAETDKGSLYKQSSLLTHEQPSIDKFRLFGFSGIRWRRRNFPLP